MPRPVRIEFENAWHHVSNTGGGGRSIFSKPQHIEFFINTLKDCIATYGIEIHAFCFLPQRYHLLIRTPQANLSKTMRQLNGLYTQGFNRIEGLDGPLFRGRYRSTIIENEYVAALSRFIDLQAVENQIVSDASQYKWSSYRAHIGRPHAHDWLKTQTIKSHCEDYAAFVNEGIDEEVKNFYLKKKQSPILGCFQFKHKLLQPLRRAPKLNRATGPSMEIIMQATAHHFEVTIEQLRASRRGQTNIPRAAAIYLSRKFGRHILVDIAAAYSGITHAAVGTTVKRFQHLLEKDTSLQQSVECIIDTLQQQQPNQTVIAEVA